LKAHKKVDDGGVETEKLEVERGATSKGGRKTWSLILVNLYSSVLFRGYGCSIETQPCFPRFPFRYLKTHQSLLNWDLTVSWAVYGYHKVIGATNFIQTKAQDNFTRFKFYRNFR
jgi:hypothetical protein